MQSPQKTPDGSGPPKAPRRPAAPASSPPLPVPWPISRKRSAASAIRRPCKKPRFDVSSRIIIVTVGPNGDAEVFSIHEDLLKQHSDYAGGALRQGWREDREGRINLVHDDARCFKVFAEFVYTGEIDFVDDGLEVDDADDATEDEHIDNTSIEGYTTPKQRRETARRRHDWLHLVHCYILGDKLLAPAFKNALLDRMCRKATDQPFHQLDGVHTLAYAQTIGPNGLTKLVLDIAAHCWIKRDFEHETRVEFLRDVTLRGWDGRVEAGKKKGPWVDSEQRYHQ